MSASHVANASVRMEPQYMIMGQAAGVAAAMAAKENQPVHRINIIELQKKLSDRGQVLSLEENTYGAFDYKDEIIIDNNMKRFTEKSRTWRGNETEHNGRYQMNYAQNDKHGKFTFKPWMKKAGLYELSIWYPSKNSYSDAVQILINHQHGRVEKVVDQQNNGGKWMILGQYEFESGYQKVLTVVSDGSGGTVVADAIKLRFIR